MASIHKPRGSKNWRAAFTDANGKQYERTTGTADRAAAMAIAREYEAAAGKEPVSLLRVARYPNRESGTQRCLKCGELKPASDFYYADLRKSRRLRTECKICSRKRSHDWSYGIRYPKGYTVTPLAMSWSKKLGTARGKVSHANAVNDMRNRVAVTLREIGFPRKVLDKLFGQLRVIARSLDFEGEITLLTEKELIAYLCHRRLARAARSMRISQLACVEEALRLLFWDHNIE